MYSNLGLLVSGINSEYFIQYLGEGFSINFGISLLKANSNSSKWPTVELMIYPSGRTEHGLIQIYSIELKKFVVPLNYFYQRLSIRTNCTFNVSFEHCGSFCCSCVYQSFCINFVTVCNADQCDQIWRNLATWAKFKKSLAIS